jgi:hypothetical protein
LRAASLGQIEANGWTVCSGPRWTSRLVSWGAMRNVSVWLHELVEMMRGWENLKALHIDLIRGDCTRTSAALYWQCQLLQFTMSLE